MIKARHIFPLAQRPLSWHHNVKAIRDVHPWSANSPSERSGATSGFCRRTRGFAVRILFCTAARVVPAMPNTRSVTPAFGALCLPSGGAFATADLPRTRCAQTVQSTPIGRRSKRQGPRRAVAASAAKKTTNPRAMDALDQPVIAVISRFAASPCLPSSSAPALTPKPRPTNSARRLRVAWRAAQTDAVGLIAQCLRRATAVADAIAHRPAGKLRLADRATPHSLVTRAEVAHPQPGHPYSSQSLRAPGPARRRLSTGDHP